MSLKRNLLTLIGIPNEVIRRFFGVKWRLDRRIMYFSQRYGQTVTCEPGMKYDKFTFAPDLRKEDGSDSDGSPIHDAGCFRGKWDSGTPMTFDQNNMNLYDILLLEGHWKWMVDLYYEWVSKPFMRKRYNERHGYV